MENNYFNFVWSFTARFDWENYIFDEKTIDIWIFHAVTIYNHDNIFVVLCSDLLEMVFLLQCQNVNGWHWRVRFNCAMLMKAALLHYDCLIHRAEQIMKIPKSFLSFRNHRINHSLLKRPDRVSKHRFIWAWCSCASVKFHWATHLHTNSPKMSAIWPNLKRNFDQTGTYLSEE